MVCILLVISLQLYSHSQQFQGQLRYFSSFPSVPHVNALIKLLQSYKHIFTVGEIDCPNPKRFNAPLTQNSFLILERILSNN